MRVYMRADMFGVRTYVDRILTVFEWGKWKYCCTEKNEKETPKVSICLLFSFVSCFVLWLFIVRHCLRLIIFYVFITVAV